MATIQGIILTTPRMSTSCPNLKLSNAKSCMLGAHETYGFHEPLHRKVQLWKMSVERGRKKSLVPGVRLIMAGYWSGQRAPAMSSRPVGAHYVNRSTGLMVFMMARVNRPVGTSFPGNQVMQCYCTRHLVQNVFNLSKPEFREFFF